MIIEKCSKLETKRLKLIPINQKYSKDIFENFTKDVITYMCPSVPINLDETIKVIDDFIDKRKKGTDLVYAIVLKDNDEFIGMVGLHSLNKIMPELGIWIKISSHGKHFGREAIGGLIDYAKDLGIKKLLYPVDIRNIPSKKIPIFYGGQVISECKEEKTKDGRILKVIEYQIDI